MRVRKGAAVQLVVLALIAGALTTGVAVIPHWLPPSAAEQADRIHAVIWYVTIICVAIFAIVVAALWTAVPFLLVTSMAVFSAIVLARNDRTGSNALHVDVTAQQFAWSFKYPDSNNVASNVLRLPVGRTVRFNLRSLDVLHSFWVPEFSQKQDTVPGLVTHVTITPTKTGVYPIICTELCGLGHPVMRSTVIVMKAAQFDRWLKGQAQATGGGGANAGKAVFANNGCNACHTLQAAGATGKIGPDLDKLPGLAEKAGQPLEQFVRESIVNPDAYIETGFPKGVMPHTFASLPKDQLDALVKYLIDSSKGAK